MSEERKYEEHNMKIPKGQKLEDFDFFELTADLSNSITDKLYRSYHPILEEVHKENSKVYGDDKIDNDLQVEDIVEEIKEKTKNKLVKKVSDDISRKVSQELSEQYHAKSKSFEDYVDKGIKSLRWMMILAFAVIGLVIFSIVLLGWTEAIIVLNKTFSVVSSTFSGEPLKEQISSVITSILSILDLLLLGSLVVMVLVGGYENTISRIGMSHSVPSWFGKVSISELKVKVAASIVIISSIHLLRAFMNIQLDVQHPIEYYYPLFATVLVHVVFVISALILAYMDKWHDK